MNPIIEKIEIFLKQFDELETLNQQSLKERSDVDKLISNWYHKLEGLQITHISQSHKLIKEIKPLLERRRDIKLEGLLLTSICDTLREKIKTLKESNKVRITKNDNLKQELKESALNG